MHEKYLNSEWIRKKAMGEEGVLPGINEALIVNTLRRRVKKNF